MAADRTMRSMPFLSCEGRRIHYTVTGEGPPLLLAHSFLCSIAMWEPQIAALSAEFQVIAVDARGHGESGEADSRFTMWDSAEDHIAVLDELKIDRAHWAGLSMGGMAGLRAALRHPSRIASLVLFDTDGGPESRFVRLKYVGMSLVARTMGVKPLVPQIKPLMFGRSTLAGQPDLVARWEARWLELHVPSMINGISAIAGREDLLPRLGAIACPAVVIVGSQDRALPVPRSQKLAAALRCECIELPDAGHLSVQEQPAVTTEAMRTFLSGVAL
jgi:pimeloyl-ACP methyl ester carboxylesterase